MARGTSNSHVRGNTRDRAARKEWLLRTFQADLGPGYCRCFRCGSPLNFRTVTVDRIVPGCKGGRYTRDNIRPACMGCNRETGARLRA